MTEVGMATAARRNSRLGRRIQAAETGRARQFGDRLDRSAAVRAAGHVDHRVDRRADLGPDGFDGKTHTGEEHEAFQPGERVGGTVGVNRAQ